MVLSFLFFLFFCFFFFFGKFYDIKFGDIFPQKKSEISGIFFFEVEKRNFQNERSEVRNLINFPFLFLYKAIFFVSLLLAPLAFSFQFCDIKLFDDVFPPKI